MARSGNRRVLVIQPFRPEFRGAFDLVAAATRAADAEAVRADEMVSLSEPITETVHRAVQEADLIVCDLTGSNPNVLYELGLARGLKKPIILISQRLQDIPFDLKTHRILVYDSSLPSQAELTRSLAALIRTVLVNPEEFERLTAAVKSAGHVFISYSHKDLPFLKRLLVHLRPLERDGRIQLFADTKLRAGDKWRDEIREALTAARVAILLVSADFLASDFIVDNELPPLLSGAERQGTRIVPVVVKPCRFTRDRNLRDFQAINSPDRPLINLPEGEQEEIFDDIARLVEDLLPS